MLDFPIVSGNVSLYNESKATGGGSAILPTPAIGGVGLMKDWTKAVGIGFRDAGDVIVVIGERQGHLGQSLYLRELHGWDGGEAGPPPPVDLIAEHAAGDFVRAAIAGGAITACHDVADGGMAVALAEMALAGNVGALINGPAPYCARSGSLVSGVYSPRLRQFRSPSSPSPMPPGGGRAIGRTGGSRLSRVPR